MKILDFIQRLKEGSPSSKSHMKNLLEMAWVDNHFDDSEFEYLKMLARKYGISNAELDQIQEEADKISFQLPDSEDEKFDQFYELVKMMSVDHKILSEEIGLCRIFARKFGYKSNDDLVYTVTENIKNGQPLEETRVRVNLLLI